MVVISKNANVANGPVGLAHAEEVTESVATKLGIHPSEVLIASTGVIGRLYPIERIRTGIAALPFPLPAKDAEEVARGIMTTDTVHKVSEATVAGSTARVVGVAKGVGMIEPDMATMISMIFTDAAVSSNELDAIFRRVVNRTFNCVSIDTDSSTSDTAIVLASGVAGAIDAMAFETALESVMLDLTKKIARDGEGAETLIEVRVDNARDEAQAKTVAKAIVNSPLVKTAVHGADPNWGRVLAAVGTTHAEFDPYDIDVSFNGVRVCRAGEPDQSRDLVDLTPRAVDILIDVKIGTATATIWTNDLTHDSVHENSAYSS
jgi:glutamate N-acetyltransferase/amino-acid N-acetyltransferase